MLEGRSDIESGVKRKTKEASPFVNERVQMKRNPLMFNDVTTDAGNGCRHSITKRNLILVHVKYEKQAKSSRVPQQIQWQKDFCIQ